MILFATLATIVSAQTDDKGYKEGAWVLKGVTGINMTNEYIKTGNEKYKQAAYSIWGFIKEYLVDKRNNSEWFWLTDENGKPYENKPLVEPWKCPYHNGRMCMEIIKRI